MKSAFLAFLVPSFCKPTSMAALCNSETDGVSLSGHRVISRSAPEVWSCGDGTALSEFGHVQQKHVVYLQLLLSAESSYAGKPGREAYWGPYRAARRFHMHNIRPTQVRPIVSVLLALIEPS